MILLFNRSETGENSERTEKPFEKDSEDKRIHEPFLAQIQIDKIIAK